MKKKIHKYHWLIVVCLFFYQVGVFPSINLEIQFPLSLTIQLLVNKGE